MEKFELTIGTSRYGTPITDAWSKISSSFKDVSRILLAFGSPRQGLKEILSQEDRKPTDLFNFFVNTVPDQHVSTVRTEEAVVISLGLINALRFW